MLIRAALKGIPPYQIPVYVKCWTQMQHSDVSCDQSSDIQGSDLVTVLYMPTDF